MSIRICSGRIHLSLSDVYAEIIYENGDTDNSSVASVVVLATIGLVALLLQGISNILTAVFTARRGTRILLLLNGTVLVLFLLTGNIGVFGQGMQALIWGMVTSYGLICALQLMFLKIEALSWRQVLLDRVFLSGAIYVVALSAFVTQWIGKTGLSAWLSIFLARFAALLSSFVMALLNPEIRTGQKVWLSENV